ncbi:LysM peptidoglycan-binding domain-containing protein [Gilvimarinus sp. F26214L]|uniref:LysM peptidoglycan-binding domain-containing protein n=1 Tax=Gilvimarinus sp. DZF01 TaxID=3461371 RepID=UPI004045F0D6
MSTISMKEPTDVVAYSVKAGDTLSAIVHRYYGAVSPPRRQEIIRSIQAANPTVKNPNFIRPGQLIKLEVPAQYCPIPDRPVYSLEDWFPTLERDWSASSPEERGLQIGLAKLTLGAGSANLSAIDRTFKGASPLLSEMVENYEEYKRGGITKGRYDYQRSKVLKQLTKRLGPTNFLVNGTRSPNEVLRISRKSGTAPTQPITQQITKMKRVSKIASRGGVALSVVGLGIACHEISQTDDVGMKNEILVESLGGLGGGLIYGLGAAIAIALMATPLGWVGTLVIGVGGALAGYAGGKVATQLYDASGRKIDLSGNLGVSTLCAPGNFENLRASAPKLSSAALSAL